MPRRRCSTLDFWIVQPHYTTTHHQHTMKPPAFKLPVLLAQLPKSGLDALVRPVKWPANSFYKVSHTDLKFRETEGKINVGGKAWGQLFWRGA